MSAPAEVLAYLQTLVWPTVVAFAAILFRRQLAALIPRLREISAAGASVKFGEEVSRLADEAGRLAQGVMEQQESPVTELPTFSPPTPTVEPTMIFLEAYRDLEMAAKDAGPAAGVVAAMPVPVIRGLARQERVPPEAVRVAEELRAIRNEVAHGARRLEPIDAENLAVTARSLATMCRSAAQRDRQRPEP